MKNQEKYLVMVIDAARTDWKRNNPPLVKAHIVTASSAWEANGKAVAADNESSDYGAEEDGGLVAICAYTRDELQALLTKAADAVARQRRNCGQPTSTRYKRVQMVLEKQMRFRQQMGDKKETVAQPNGKMLSFAPEVIAVTDDIHKSGKDANSLSRNEIIMQAIPIFERIAKESRLKQTTTVHVPSRREGSKAKRSTP
jgi:hypothetical protein